MGLSLSIIFCYFINAISFLMIALTSAQGFYQFQIAQANHPTIAIIALMIYLFAQTFITYFFIAIKTNIFEIKSENQNLEHIEFRKKALQIKSSTSRFTYTNILLFIIAFTLGGGVHTGYLPLFWHRTFVLIFITHYILTLQSQHKGIKNITLLFWESIEYTHPKHTQTKQK